MIENCPEGLTYAFSGHRKFIPVCYRTLALWGRSRALTPLFQLITPSRASGTADNEQSLDYLFITAPTHPHTGTRGNH